MVHCIRHGYLKKSVQVGVTSGASISVEVGAEIGTEIEAGNCLFGSAKVSASLSTTMGTQWQKQWSTESQVEVACSADYQGPEGRQCMYQWVVEESHYDIGWHTLFTECVAGQSPP